MAKALSPEEQHKRMTETSVTKLVISLSIPTVLSQMITSVYNMADTYFVTSLGDSSVGAISIVFAFQSIIQAIGFGLAMGASSLVSRKLGQEENQEANKYASCAFYAAFVMGLLLMAGCLIDLNGLLRLFGSTETILPYAHDYAFIILLGAPIMCASFVMNNVTRAQGHAVMAMVGLTAGGILNMLLDPLFIFGFGMGTAGAAIATALSQMVSFFILLLQCNLRRDTISIHPRHFRPTKKMYWKILYVGFPSLGRQGIASVANILLNNTVKACVTLALQDPAISAISIVSRFVMFINSSVIGFGQGFQPVCGFNYGAGQYSRVRKAFWFSVKVTTMILLVLGLVAFIFARPIITAFRAEDAEVIRIGTLALRMHLITIPLWGFIVMGNMFTQSIGYGGRATLLSASRQGIFLIPALLTLPRVLPLAEANVPFAIAAAQPVADALSLVMAIFIVMSIMKQFKQMPDKPQAP